MAEKWIKLETEYARVKEWLKPASNTQSLFSIMADIHLNNRETFSENSLEHFGIPRDFMVSNDIDHLADPSVIFGAIFTDLAIHYGFPADVIVLDIARANGLNFPEDLSNAIDAMKI